MRMQSAGFDAIRRVILIALVEVSRVVMISEVCARRLQVETRQRSESEQDSERTVAILLEFVWLESNIQCCAASKSRECGVEQSNRVVMSKGTGYRTEVGRDGD